MTSLRPILLADVPVLERQYSGSDQTGEFGWFGYKHRDLAADIAAGRTVGDERGHLAVIDDDGTPVGDVGYRRVFHGPQPNGSCWNVGVWIAPDHRGQGHGSRAQRQLAAYLFAHTFLERVEASTEAGNVAEQRALESAGFTREGVVRRSCFRDGQWRDMVLYSRLRGED